MILDDKIDCRDCKYSHTNPQTPYLCGNHKLVEFNLADYKCITLNPEGKCELYERKWWKFWKKKGLEKI